MSTAAVSSAYAAEGVGGSSSGGGKRRSLFRPSTWKTGKTLAETGLSGHHHRGGQTLDGVETGAPLAALVESETHATAGEAPSSSPLRTQPDAQGRIAFFRQDQPNFHLSNASPHAVTYNSTRYPTAEHLFQSLKFLPAHPEIAAKVRRAKTPLDAMRIARSHTALYNAGWISTGENVRVMHHVVLAKFSQYSALTDALLDTDEREIVNASPTDVFWGSGENGRGRNVLGKTLMDVREVLRANRGVGWGSAAKTM
ncbi:conserved hypothetical protein [Sporisorium reilianum SRZ2]|uniref:NADAR domain-containing protein n=1 Tax=Sporisorium reilianum (strain SRZ2) TaxID=999809 RepID=E6ZWM7_SPORE|nr:conserved hypothetical protein [Sporisorium reilianum SRZ2]